MDTVTLKRGRAKITLNKTPNQFAVRLKSGRANSLPALDAACGPSPGEKNHLDSAARQNLELFAIKNDADLNGAMTELRKSPACQVVSHTYTVGGSTSEAMIPTGALTVQFSPALSNQGREDIMAAHGLELVKRLPYLPDAYVLRCTAASTQNPLKIAKVLQDHDQVLVAEPDLAFKRSAQYQPACALYPHQWHLHNAGGDAGLRAGADVAAEAAWDISLGKREITVCIIDDGFDLDHPELNAADKIVAPWDFGEDDADPRPVEASDNHGTACAGVALAEGSAEGLIGLAPRCSFMPIRAAQWVNDATIEAYFRHAVDHHADVISCSWSASVPWAPLSTNMDAVIHWAATQGRKNGQGCVILFAAGNENVPLEGSKTFELDDGSEISIDFHYGFALHPNVICVGASNSLDQRSNYSNYGPGLTLCAPSDGDPGHAIVTIDRVGDPGYLPYSYVEGFGGTSSATPLAAGLAALILSVKPTLSSAEVRQLMTDTAEKIDPDHAQYDSDGHSIWAGHGRINAGRALRAALGLSEDRLPPSLHMEHWVDKPIVDNGLTRDVIHSALDEKILGIVVQVDIQHSWRGDLRIELQTPAGDKILLARQNADSSRDFVRSFRSSDRPDLFQAVLGESLLGDWELIISDTAPDDVGILRKWGLTLSY